MKHVYTLIICIFLAAMSVNAQTTNAGGNENTTRTHALQKDQADGLNGLPPTGLELVDNNDGSVTVSWVEPGDLNNFLDYSLYRSEQQGFVPGPLNLVSDNIADTSYMDTSVEDFRMYYYIVSANFGGGSPEELFSDEAGILVNNTTQTTVLGYAFLEDRNNHANIKVSFIPQSPSAVADSIYTNALGYFETSNIFPGVYSVRYSKAGFQTPQLFENISIVDDMDLGESTLWDIGTTVSGDVSGTWSGFMSVDGDVTVPQGDSLIIDAGTVVRFLGYYHFQVYGYLAINGAAGDSVRITSSPVNQQQAANQWQGFNFWNESNDNSYLHYTIVEYAYDGVYAEWSKQSYVGCTFYENGRYGLSLNRSDGSEITNSVFVENNNTGLYMTYTTATISGSEFTNNSSWNTKIADYSKLVMDNCLIENANQGIHTQSYSDLRMSNSIVRNITSNGIYIQDVYARGAITNNQFEYCDNGIYLYYRSHTLIEGNTFAYNSDGIEIYYECDSRISANTFIANNNGIRYGNSSHYCQNTISYNVFAYQINDGIYKGGYTSSYNNDLNINYNTFFGNGGDGIQINSFGTDTIKNNVVYDNGNWGLNLSLYTEVIENNSIYSNAAGEISNLDNAPSETWNFISVNPNNNTTCDIYRNISEDPAFNLSDTLDVSLQATSKCIDGGSEENSDPDGSISDIGAFPFDKGNPHMVYATGYGDQYVSLEWQAVENDSLVDYKVYYRESDSEADFSLFGNTAATSVDVTSLTNNTPYDFTVTGNYANYESTYAPQVIETPGVAEIDYDPGSFALVIPSADDSIVDNFTVTNTGSRDLNISFPVFAAETSSAYFDGSGDYLSYGHHDHMAGLNAFTMECWLYRQNNGHFEFMGKNYRVFQFAINSNEEVQIYKGYGNASQQTYQSWDTDQYINANQWYHLAITWEGTTVKLYINGELSWQVDNAVDQPTTELHYSFDIGRRGGENNYYMQGRLYEARLWNVARTPDDIKEFQYQPMQGDEEGLIGYWPLTEDFNDHSVYGLQAGVNGNTVISDPGHQVYNLYSVPQGAYTVAAGDTEIVPMTFYKRDDVSSQFFTTRIHTDDLAAQMVDIEIALQHGETVPATPVHFIPVEETGNPYTIYITDATIDRNTIEIGDEIGIFDGDVCVGAGIYNGEFNFIFTCWQEDPGKGENGFTPGNPMTFKMYDTSADLETNEADEVYFIGDDTFGYGNFSALSLEASVYNIQDVAVTGGQFNLVSFNLLPRYPNASNVFGEVSGLQIAYNDDGGVFIPGYNINTIGDISFLDGFYLYGDETTTIAYEGTFIHEEDWELTVEPAKWNYISVLSQDPVAVTDVFAGLETEISIVQSASGDSWIPDQGINTLGNMQPGTGYKVALAVDTAVGFSYPAGGKKSALVPEDIAKKEIGTRENSYFNVVETGLPYAVIVKIKNTNETIYDLIPGDEIGLFDGASCVGSAVYQGGHQLLITTWAQDETQNLPGFVPGNAILAKVYHHTSGLVYSHKLITNHGSQPHFDEGNYGVTVLITVPDSEGPAFFSVAPNPFKNSTELIVELAKEGNVNVQVFDRSGRLVKEFHNQSPNTYHKMVWDGTDLTGQKLNPGVYFIIAETSAEVFTEKVIVLQ